MAIASGQVLRRLTSREAVLGASEARASLGGYASSTGVLSGSLHALFDEVTGPQNQAGRTDYRCIAYALDQAATSSLSGIKLWFPRLDVRGATYAIGLDPLGVRDYRTLALATTIPDPTAAPAGVAFSTPTTEASGLAVAAISPAQGFAVWVRRSVLNSPQATPESNLLRLSGTS